MGTDMPRPRGGNGLDEGRLAASVLADEHGQTGRGLEAALDQLADGRDREGPPLHPHLAAIDIDPAQRRSRQRAHRANLLRPRLVTRLLSPAAAVELTLANDGTPAFITGALHGAIDPIARWKVETEWWNRAVVREYWKVVVGSDLLCELYHDLDRDQWFVERIYD
jgi:hypothetical protein